MSSTKKATILPGDIGPGRSDNFLYIERYPVVGEVNFQTREVKELYDRWQKIGPNIASWGDLNLDGEFEFRPHYYLIKVLGDGQFLYQRNGKAIDRLVGAFMKGNLFGFDDELAENKTLARYFQEVVDDQLCYRCCGDLVCQEELKQFESVDCPLVDDEGVVIATIGALALVGE